MKTLVEAQKEAWGNLPIIITITTKKWKIEGKKLKKNQTRQEVEELK